VKKKTSYRVRNWGEYNAALVGRGRVTFWIDAQAAARWLEAKSSGKRGASCLYSSAAIECVLLVASVYGLSLRGAQGFVESIFALMGLPLPVPHYSTLCRRRKTLQVNLRANAGANAGGLHLVVDGTGLKVYGEGEWKVRKHGWCKRRQWLNVQVGLDRESQQIVAVASREHAWSDKSGLPLVLDQVKGPLASVTGDGAYDARSCYEAIAARGARAIIPPFRRAQHRREKVYASRNAAVARIRELEAQGQEGRKRWKEEVGYHKRSRIETTMMQLKTIFGDTVSARTIASQECEVRVRCLALNRMMSLGMPQSVAV
jgi:hypothetical protein